MHCAYQRMLSPYELLYVSTPADRREIAHVNVDVIS